MKNENIVRFSINLNGADPLHKTVINALNVQGRHKTQFIVNAIMKYIMEGGDKSVRTEINRDEIREIVLSVLEEQKMSKTDSVRKIAESTKDENISDIAAFSDVGESDLMSIAVSLSDFKKK